ncbi:discoidin domain-containing protein [Dactylosporangium sp. NPDC006015]|uniref:discoidin domain-containing protein n=1 Tax=Dactylosporangium sp. NPDC006015 TaxID=3154576 RepID=UPI0033AD88B5
MNHRPNHRPHHRQGRRLTAAGTALLGAGVAALVTVTSAAPAHAATPTPTQQWTDVQNLVGPIRGVWTSPDAAGAISRSMPNTALLGNGDIGVTSGGSAGAKTFYVSKGDFWAGNPNPSFVALGGVTIAPAAAAPSGNLALGATATATSAHPDFPPPRAVSGQWGSGYEGWVSQIGKPQTLTLDLGSAKTFDRYVVRHDSAARPAETANNTKNFTLQTSTDGSAWATADTVTNNMTAVTDRTVTSRTVRYVRLNITEPTQGTTADSSTNPRARIGQLELYAPGTGPGTPPASGAFREEQNILRGDVDTTMTLAGQPVTMRTWTAADRNLVVTQLQSTGTTTVSLKAETFAGAVDARSGFTNTAGVSGQTLWATRRTPTGPRWVSEASLATRLVGGTVTGTPSASGATARLTFDLAPGQTVRLVTAVAGGGQNPTGTAAAAQSLAGAQTGAALDGLYTSHVDWWKGYWLRSYLNVGDDVLHRYYYGALYLLGSSIRPGRLSPGLYGIWATSDSPQFSGDMHLNYNYMANFYGVYSSNRTDLAQPYFDLVAAYLPEARRRARQDLNRVKPDYVSRRFPSGGVPAGLLFPVGIAPYGATADDNYHQQVGNALFVATQYLAYYDYTRDRAFLQNTAYPVLKEVAAFFSSWLELDPATGRYNLWSGPHEGLWGRNSSPDLGMLRTLLSALVDASVELNTDASLRATWQNLLAHLPPQPTTVVNGRTVYAVADPGTISGSDTRAIHPGDNTVNLEFIHPGEALGLSSPAAERQAAIDTLNAMNSWGQDNSFPKVFTQAARAGYPAQSLIDQLRAQIIQKQGPNLRIVDPSHGLEKSGAVEAVDSLLLQSDDGVIRVFPVWPATRDASFVNLREKGAFLVSSRLSAGRVSYVDIVSQAGRQVTLLNPWGTQPVTVTRAGAGTVAHTTANGTVSFPTQAGATYQIVPA